ncbi:MAG TPA: sulfite exporter TauE/SafE family protein [Burkholderiaceae bacterium]|nr:sulfite exporter TauE/SafE family protein [Burkholderiaceae bacterium]
MGALSPFELAALLAGAVVAGFVQGLSGFAFSMVSMALWVWVLDPKLAAVMAVFGALVGQLIGLFTVPRRLAWRELAPFVLGGLAGIPLGVGLLPRLDAEVFKFGVGALLVVACPAMLFASRLPRAGIRSPTLARGADALAGVGGGVMGGLGGFTGVVPTLWCTLRGMDKAAQRSVVQNFNLATLAVTMLAYAASGAVTRPMWPLLPLVAAAVLVPSLIGARFYHRLSEQSFRRVVLGLLTAAGAVMLVAAAPRVLQGG